jgi:type II secretory pathway pseudopilin PulG
MQTLRQHFERNQLAIRQKGQSLMEIMIAVAIMGMVLSSVAGLVYVGLLASRVSRENSHSLTLIQDMSSAVRGLAAMDWRALWGSTGLVGYWSLDEGMDTAAFDPIGGNNGTLIGGPVWQVSANCRIGQCILFDGADDQVNVGSGTALTRGITNALTVTAWVRPGSIVSGARNAAAQHGGGSDGWILRTSQVGDGRFTPHVFVGGGWRSCSGPVLATDTWVHLALTYNGATLIGYVNGAVACQHAGTAANLAMAGPTTIASAFNFQYFHGFIDDVRIYNRVLSVEEISRMHAMPGSLHPRNRGGFWVVEEGSQMLTSPLFGDFTRWFDIGAVRRDAGGAVVTTGGIPDPSTIKVHYRIVAPRGRTISASEYITRSESRVMAQEDWSGGPHATGVYTSATNVFAASHNIDVTSTPGTMSLITLTSGWLESAVFDTQQIGGVAYNYIMWRGTGGGGSTSQVDFQIASSNSATGPWTFVGHDCAAASRYGNVVAGAQRPLTARCHTGHRYFRYRIELLSIGGGASPVVDDIFVGWSP